MKNLKVEEHTPPKSNEMVLMTVRVPNETLEFAKEEAKRLKYKSLGGFIRELIDVYKRENLDENK